MRLRSPALLRSCAILAAMLLLAPCADAQRLFPQPTLVPTGNWPAAVYTADINADGIPDLIYIDAGATYTASTTHILLGDSHGKFSQTAILPTVGTSLALADMDGDGTIDLVWVGTSPPPPGTGLDTIGSYTVFVAHGNGDGTFQAPSTYGTPIYLTPSNPPLSTFRLDHVAVGHFYNKSGSLDVVFEETTQNELCKVDGSSIMGAGAVGISAGTGPILVSDLNGDGYQDIVIQQSNTNILTLLGGPRFAYSNAPMVAFSGLTGIRSSLLNDVNGDGIPDLIAEGAAGHIDVFLGKSDGTFQTTSSGGTGSLDGTTGNGGHLIALGDFNHDGQLDALTSTPAGISTLLGQSTQYFGLKGIYNAGPGHNSYDVADFNGDGNPDLAVDSPEGIAILYGNPDGSFQTNRAFAAGQPAMSGALGVFTGSGNLDSVVSTGATQAQWLRGQGNGTFTFNGSPGTPVPTNSTTGTTGVWSVVQAADLDSDGNLDILLTADGPTAALPKTATGAQIQLGDGTGGFASIYPVSQHSGPACPQSPGYFYGTSAVGINLLGAIFVNRGFDGFTYFLNGNHHPPGQGDYSNDEIDGSQPCGPYAHDVAVTGVFTPRNSVTQQVSDVIAQADGHLYLYPTYNYSDYSVAAGDLSIDGSLTTPGQLTAPVLNSTFNGPAIPTSAGGLGFPAFIGSAVAADLDRDGNQDLIAVYANLSANLQAPTSSAPNAIYIWFGNGNGQFPTSTAHPVNPVVLTPSRNFYQVAIADLNGDGIPDLILSDGYLVSIQYGNGNGTFGPENHFLAGQGINSISVGDVNGDGKPDLVLANGGAVLTNPVANLETLATNPDVNTGGITVLLNGASSHATYTPTGTVTASPEPTYYGQAFNLTATITPPGSSTAVSPTGTVSFFVNGVSAGAPVTVSASSASIAVASSVYAAVAPGTYAITAEYSGDSNYAPATFTASHVIARWPTMTVLTPDPPLVSYYNYALGLNGTFAVSIPIGGSPVAPTGNYTLLDNGVAVAICTSIPLNAQCDYGYPVLLNAGVHSFVIEYLGDTYTAPSFSVPVVFTILPDLTSAILTAAPTTVVAGQSIAFNATLTGNLAVPTGPVLFYDGAGTNQSLIATVNLNTAGIATLNTSTLASGTHTITAVYPATQNFNAASSNSITVTILPINPAIPTVISLSSSVNPSAPGQPVTFTAVVNTTGLFIYDPTGSVTFLDGTNVLGTGTLNQYGIATFTSSTLASGSHAITASYPGATGSGTALSFAPATSAVLTQIVYYAIPMAPVGFILNVTPTPVTVPDGAIATLQVTVTPTSGFAQPVLLACTGLPREATCTFEQTTIPSGGGTTTLFLAAASPHPCGDPGDPYYSRTGPLTAIPVFAALGLLLLPRRRRLLTRRIATLFALILLTALANLSGCGTCTDLGTSPGKYSFKVTGTAQGGPVTLTVSQTIPLTVSNP